MNRPPRSCTSVNAVWRKSLFVTTGTGRPRNAVCRCTRNGSGLRRRAALPAQHVEHTVVDPHPEPDEPVLGRRQAGGDRGQCAGGGGRCHRGDRAALEAAERRQQAAVRLDRLPADAVEEQQHDRRRTGDRGGHPGHRLIANDRRYQARNACPAVVGTKGIHAPRVFAGRAPTCDHGVMTHPSHRVRHAA